MFSSMFVDTDIQLNLRRIKQPESKYLSSLKSCFWVMLYIYIQLSNLRYMF